MRLRHLPFAAAAVAAAPSLVAAAPSEDDATSPTDADADAAPRLGRRLALSPSEVDRRMSRARLLLTDDEEAEKLKKIDLGRFSTLLESAANEEFGEEDDAERAKELWAEQISWDWEVAVSVEEKFLGGEEGVTKDDAQYAYLICSGASGTALERKEGIKGIIHDNKGDLVDVEDDFVYRDAVRALQTVYNDGDATCFLGRLRASVVAVIAAASDDVDVLPLSSWAKTRSGVVEAVLDLAYPEGWKKDEGRNRWRRRAQDGEEGDADGPVGPADPLENDKPGVNESDVDGSTKVEDSDSSLDVAMCPGVAVDDLPRLGDKLRDFLLRKSDDGSRNYASTLTPYANLTDEELESGNYPERVLFWRRVFELGIDSEGGCGDTLDRLEATVSNATGAAYEGEPVGVSFALKDGGAQTSDADVACVLGLIFGLTLLPQVCSVQLTNKNEVFNDYAQWIVQGGSEAKENRPFWEEGITGEGQVVAVSDSGVDVNHCHFWDSEHGMNANGGYDMARRKIIQYIPYIDATDEESGHGTHVAGTIIGHVAKDGKTETDGKADGVARDARLAFIDCSSGGPGLSIPPAQDLLGTGREGGAKLHSASWGSTLDPYRYDTMSFNIDSYIYSNWDNMLMLVAAGNSGRVNNPRSLGSPAVAKNVLAVAAGQSEGSDLAPGQRGMDYVADFSSEGPTSDLRIAPQVVGPGFSILSSNAIPSDEGECEPDVLPIGGSGTRWGVTFKAGTSMATPAVAGAAALVRQYFADGYFPSGAKNSTPEASVDPSGTLVKAVLINGGQPMIGKDNGLGVAQGAPYDSVQGFGRVSLIDTLRLKGQNNINARIVDRVAVKDQESETYQVIVNHTICAGKELRATLVWADPAGASGCIKCLVNDLDLTLTDDQTGNIYYPNGKTGRDSVNNVERIVVSPDRLNDGDAWTAKVAAVNLDRSQQQFSLVMSGCFSYEGMGDLGELGSSVAGTIGSWLAAAAAALTSAYFLASEMGRIV